MRMFGEPFGEHANSEVVERLGRKPERREDLRSPSGPW